jgi:threonine dehydrogenase-like Zn-dependent dehydrogenase
VGSEVKHLKEGDRTLVPFLQPAWAERIKTDAPWLRPLPPGDVNQFAMMGVNPPTAYLLLTDIVKLPPGSWVIQNGANSFVGRATIAIAKSLGLRTVNVVRRDEVVAELKTLGGDVVVVDKPDLAKRVTIEAEKCGDRARARWRRRHIVDEPDELPVGNRRTRVLRRYGPQADGRSSRGLDLQEADSGSCIGTGRPRRTQSRRCSLIWRR